MSHLTTLVSALRRDARNGVMVKIKKCRSRKHTYGGCGNARCPEGMSIQKALDQAVSSQDFNDFLKAKDVEAKNLTDPMLNYADYKGYGVFHVDVDGKRFYTHIPIEAKGVRAQVDAVDKDDIPSFSTARELRDHVDALYGKAVLFHFHIAMDNTESRYPIAQVSELYTHAAYRGLGAGNHILKMVRKFADEHEVIVGITPTDAGDGSLWETNENKAEVKAAGLAHRDRLIKFYGRYGYKVNPLYYYHGRHDYLTGEAYQYDRDVITSYPDCERNPLEESNVLVRLPHDQPLSTLKTPTGVKREPARKRLS